MEKSFHTNNRTQQPLLVINSILPFHNDSRNGLLSTDDRIINNFNISTTSLNDILKIIDSTDA